MLKKIVLVLETQSSFAKASAVAKALADKSAECSRFLLEFDGISGGVLC